MGVDKGDGDEKTSARGKRRGLQADMVAAKRKVWVMRGERARARECGEGTQTRVHRGKRAERSQASWRWVVEERAEAKGSGAAWCKHGCTDEETPQRLTPWRDLRAAQIHHDGRREGRNRPREHRLIKGKQQRWLWASSVGCPRGVWWWWREGREGTQLEMTGCWARRWPRADQRDQAHPPRREERRMGHRNDSVACCDHRHGIMNGQLCVARRPLPRRAKRATLRPLRLKTRSPHPTRPRNTATVKTQTTQTKYLE
jgi:hypothetical protein